MIKLFLDDIRIPSDCFQYMKEKIYLDEDWVIVRSYEEFIDYIKNNGVPDFWSADHDLAEEHYAPSHAWDNDNYHGWEAKQDFREKTGLDCAKWLSEFCIENRLPLPEYRIHSKNPYGGQNIKSLLDNHKKHVLL